MDYEERPLLDPSLSIDREFCLRHEGVWSEGIGTEQITLKIAQDEINRLKEQISHVCTKDDDGLRRWRLHTQNTHPLSMAPKLLRDQYNCPGTSQAYCKFLEILRRYRLVHPTLGQLRLNPHHEDTNACDMLLDDDLILRHPEQWYFGDDGSGDICKRYLICMRFRGDRAKLTEQNKAETEELGVYRDRIFSEFHKRALTKFISTPTRESHLNQETLERPWIDMFGKNYVERLRSINDERSALEHLRIFVRVFAVLAKNLREDLMSEHEEGESEVEVEFSEDELEFFGWEGYRLCHERNERIEQLEIVWSEPSIPFVLSRYSVSVIVLLSVMFFQLKIGGGHQVAVFTKP
ncbi:hypothetical protein ANCDUO_17002, partial [Ancylostoma duodenale]